MVDWPHRSRAIGPARETMGKRLKPRGNQVMTSPRWKANGEHLGRVNAAPPATPNSTHL